MNTVERLEELLNEKDDALQEAQEEIRILKKRIDEQSYHDQWKWRHLRQLSSEENLDLPLPRLELRRLKVDKYDERVDYGLVYRHYLGHIEFVPISSTHSTGSISEEFDLSPPRRDGVHIMSDMLDLGLRGFIVCGKKCKEIELTPDNIDVVLANKHRAAFPSIGHGCYLISAERARQIRVEGWSSAHDDEHDRGEMVAAAIFYANDANGCNQALNWPWDPEWYKHKHSPIRKLQIAGALIAAEIDRRLRKGEKL